MLKLIRRILQNFIDNIDADNTNLTFEQQCDILKILSNIDNPDQEMNKTQAAEYLNMSRATFDNRIKDGLIPKGKQVGDFKELRWYKSDLDIYRINNKQ